MKNVIRIFNIILVAISAVAIAFIAFTPLMQMNVDYTVDKEKICEIFKGKLDSENGGVTDEELEEIVDKGTGGKGITFSLSLKLESAGMKKMRDATNDARVEALRDEVFKPVIQQVIDNKQIKGIIQELARTMAKKMAKKTVKDQIKEHFASDEDKADPEFLDKVGITDEFLDDQVDIIYDSLIAEDATISSVADSIVDVLLNTTTTIAENSGDDSYKPGGENYTSPEEIQAKKAEIEETLEQTLKDNNLCDDDGNILSVDEALALIVSKMMEESNGSSSVSSSSSEEEEKESVVLVHYEQVSDEDKKTEENTKTLSEVVTEAAWKALEESVFKDESTKNQIGDILGMVSKYGMIVQYVFMGMWGILAVFAIIKIFSKKKPYVYMGFFWWVAIVIFGFVEVVFGALLFIKPILTALGSAVSLPAELAGLEFSMYSNLSVTWICNTILFFFSIAYAIIAHKVKIDYKVEKRAKKAAKAA